MIPAPRGLYVHIPFCQHKCLYCDFNTYAGLESLIPAYLQALEQEIRIWGEAAAAPGSSADTLFFGGGTPSLLPPADLGRLIDTCRETFGLREAAEITMEANPASFRQVDLAALRAVGVNRISFGAQSFQPELLQFLERLHDSAEIGTSIRTARQAGFANLSLDLIYGLPYQSIGQWADDIDRAVDLGTEHLSLYCLTVEEKTPLYQRVRAGLVPEPDPDLAADMYDLAAERLAGAGFEQYEISNWARPGFAARHNLIYWRNQPYLGFGPGAHSCLGGWRFWNLDSPRAYIRIVRDGAAGRAGESPEFAPAGVRPLLSGERISAAGAAAETMMLGLRLSEGVSRPEFEARHGFDPVARWPAACAELTELNLLDIDAERLRLAPPARLLGNEVFCRFLGDAE